MLTKARRRPGGKAREWGLNAACSVLRDRSARSVATRDIHHRRRYAEDPWAYSHDIVGVTLSTPQGMAIDAVMGSDRILLPGGNGLGKTFVLALLANWLMDARASLPGETSRERGARVLLPGPDHSTIFETIYSEMLAIARRCEKRGHLMPGERSTKSVLWRVREQWNVEAFSPPTRQGEKQAHGAAGRHQLEQWAIIAEGKGVPKSVWSAMEGTCSTEGNKIVSDSNPTEPFGPFYEFSQQSSWTVQHLSVFDHENITQRELVIPKATSVSRVESRIRDWCRDLGVYPHEATPDADFDDFLWALPPEGAEEPGPPRDDGNLGHRDGELRVYRPTGEFAPKVLGKYPKDSSSSLFEAAAWDKAVKRWKISQGPRIPPHRIGVDASRGGKDNTCVAPAWGEDARTLLLRWMEAQQAGDQKELERLQQDHRIRVGSIQTLPKTKPNQTAKELLVRFPKSHWMVENAGGGESILEYATDTLGYSEMTPINPWSPPPARLHEEPLSANIRAAMYHRAAMLVARGLVDVPDDQELREEVMATEMTWGRLETIDGEKQYTAQVIKKDRLRKTLGRSPDKADAFVLSLCQPTPEEEYVFF